MLIDYWIIKRNDVLRKQSKMSTEVWIQMENSRWEICLLMESGMVFLFYCRYDANVRYDKIKGRRVADLKHSHLKSRSAICSISIVEQRWEHGKMVFLVVCNVSIRSLIPIQPSHLIVSLLFSQIHGVCGWYTSLPRKLCLHSGKGKRFFLEHLSKWTAQGSSGRTTFARLLPPSAACVFECIIPLNFFGLRPWSWIIPTLAQTYTQTNTFSFASYRAYIATFPKLHV
jgi:hypothetical protein